MIGAIIGDICGSYLEVLEARAKDGENGKRSYQERIQILDPKTSLFTDEVQYTDDTCLTVAVADALLHNQDYEAYIKEYGLKEMNIGMAEFGRSRFGSGVIAWLKGEGDGISYGNGGAMRVSPIGLYYNSFDKIMEEAKKSAIPTHNHEEAITSAQAVACAVFLARMHTPKKEIKEYIEKTFGYDLNYSLEQLQKEYRFTSRSSESIPQALFCFLESNSFEDALRKSLSIGGDSDTIASIAGALGECYYGVPESFVEKMREYIPPYMLDVVDQFYRRTKTSNNKDIRVYEKSY